MIDFSDVVESIATLPSIGPRSAAKIAQHLLENKSESLKLLENIAHYVQESSLCRRCRTYTVGQDICNICNDHNRQNILCVIPSIRELAVFTAMQSYKGYYFIMHDLAQSYHIEALKKLLTDRTYDRLIIALPLSPEGESMTFIISSMAKTLVKEIKTFRVGLPRRADLTYLDPVTLSYVMDDLKDVE